MIKQNINQRMSYSESSTASLTFGVKPSSHQALSLQKSPLGWGKALKMSQQDS